MWNWTLLQLGQFLLPQLLQLHSPKFLFHNVVMNCFPVATTPTSWRNPNPGLLDSFPAIMKVIVHVGTNDTARHQSELTKGDFIRLFNLLNSCGEKTVWGVLAGFLVFILGSSPCVQCTVMVLFTTLTCSGSDPLCIEETVFT